MVEQDINFYRYKIQLRRMLGNNLTLMKNIIIARQFEISPQRGTIDFIIAMISAPAQMILYIHWDSYSIFISTWNSARYLLSYSAPRRTITCIICLPQRIVGRGNSYLYAGPTKFSAIFLCSGKYYSYSAFCNYASTRYLFSFKENYNIRSDNSYLYSGLTTFSAIFLCSERSYSCSALYDSTSTDRRAPRISPEFIISYS